MDEIIRNADTLYEVKARKYSSISPELSQMLWREALNETLAASKTKEKYYEPKEETNILHTRAV